MPSTWAARLKYTFRRSPTHHKREKHSVPTYRVKFRAGDADDQLIEAGSMGSTRTYYAFYGHANRTVAQVDRNAVLSVAEEKAERS